MAVQRWKKGRGKLGPLAPLIGEWEASAETQMGPVKCLRAFERILGNTYVALHAVWEFGDKGAYEELAVFGVDAEGKITFSSFTSDGKSSRGEIADVTD